LVHQGVILMDYLKNLETKKCENMDKINNYDRLWQDMIQWGTLSKKKSVDRQTEYDESLAAIRAAGDNLVDLITRGLSTQLESIK
jgi:hypothetical protein